MDSLPSVPKSPIRAGVYYSPQFSAQEFTRAGGSHIYVVPIGTASVRLFDDLYPRVFDKTVEMTSLSTEEFAAQSVDVVIAPSLEHFDFGIGMDSDSDRYSVSYRMTLYSGQGVPLAPSLYILEWDQDPQGGQGSETTIRPGGQFTVASTFLGPSKADIRDIRMAAPSQY
jgi:hypothetical protein